MLGMLRSKGDLGSDNFAGRTIDKKEWSRIASGDAAGPSGAVRRRRNHDTNDRKFNVNIDRYDEFGRVLTPKEAFRQDCWQFHGIFPSKNSRAKRIEKFQEDQKLKAMDQDDTPTHGVEKMKIAQGMMQTPYLVLSGHVKPGQVSDPSSGLATVERRGDLGGLMTSKAPLSGARKVEKFLERMG